VWSKVSGWRAGGGEEKSLKAVRGGDNQRDWQMITTDPNYADDPQASNS